LLYTPERHILPILNEICRRELPVRLHAPNGLHARYVTRPLAEQMRRAGFVTVRLGLESADPAQQARDGRKVDDEVFARAVEALLGARLSHEISFGGLARTMYTERDNQWQMEVSRCPANHCHNKQMIRRKLTHLSKSCTI
jgi:hypothetical protein